jgi:hypothetical protein
MTRHIVPLLVVVGLLCCSCALAQTDTGTTDNTAPVQPGPTPAYTYPDTTPSLDFLTGSIENSSITLGANAGFSFDSNGYPGSNGTNNRWLTNLGGSIRIQQFLPRFSWDLAYSGGLQIYKQLSGRSSSTNRYAQSASGGFLWQLSKHWQMKANDRYAYSADPFDSFRTIPGTPTANNPNAVSYYPLTNFTQNSGILTLTDRLSKRDTMSFTGTADLRRTSNYNLLTSVPFYNLVSYGGRFAYSHQLSARLSLGGGYDYNSLDFGKGYQRSGIQTITVTADYLLGRNMTITGWVGPQHTSTKSTVSIPNPFPPPTVFTFISQSSLWSTALGVNFGWKDRRNAVRVGYSRSVSDGGGITATSQVNSVFAGYRRQINRKWSGVLGMRYLNSTSTTQQNRTFNNYFINAGVDYQIAKSFTATADYGRVHQSHSNAFVINTGTYNDNRVGVTISYHWSHPLGR